MNPTDPDFPPRLRERPDALYNIYNEIDVEREFAKTEVFCAEQQQHVGSLALYATVTLKKLPKKVRQALAVIGALWAIVLLALGIGLAVGYGIALTGFVTHDNATWIMGILWIVLAIIGIISCGVVFDGDDKEGK